MRQFLVLGFNSAATTGQGEIISIGTDRGDAIKAVSTQSASFVRQELFELAVPHIRKQFKTQTHDAKSNKKRAKK